MNVSTQQPVETAITRWRDALPEELLEQRIFLLWVKKPKPGKPGKYDKIPYYANGGKRHGTQGSADDRARLVDFADAVLAFKGSRCDGIGIALLPTAPIWALDLDDCVADGVLSPLALRVAECGTYVEYSPSGQGVRALFAGKIGFDAKNHAAGVETFNHRGFVTVTGERINGDSLIACPTELLAEILSIVRTDSDKPLASTGKRLAAEVPAENAELLQGVKLPPEVWRRLVSPYPPGCDRSATALSIACQLRRHGLTQEQCLELVSIPEMLVPALERRDGDIERARAWMWAYVVMPAYHKRERAA